MATTAPKKKRQTSQGTWIALVVVLIVAAGVGWWLFDRRARAAEFNRIVETMVNEGKFEEAAPAFEKYLASNPPADYAKEARHELARCYVMMGDKPEMSMKQRAEWFKKAQSIDASVLEPQHVQEIELANKLPVEE